MSEGHWWRRGAWKNVPCNGKKKREREQQRERHAERAVFRVVLSRNNEELIMKLNTSVFRPQTELQTWVLLVALGRVSAKQRGVSTAYESHLGLEALFFLCDIVSNWSRRPDSICFFSEWSSYTKFRKPSRIMQKNPNWSEKKKVEKIFQKRQSNCRERKKSVILISFYHWRARTLRQPSACLTSMHEHSRWAWQTTEHLSWPVDVKL